MKHTTASAGGTSGVFSFELQHNYDGTVSFSFVTEALSAASHTFQIQADGAGSFTVSANASQPAYLMVEEMPH